MRKKLSSILIALLVCLSIAGCSKTKPTEESSETSVAVESSAAIESSEPEESSTVELTKTNDFKKHSTVTFNGFSFSIPDSWSKDSDSDEETLSYYTPDDNGLIMFTVDDKPYNFNDTTIDAYIEGMKKGVTGFKLESDPKKVTIGNLPTAYRFNASWNSNQDRLHTIVILADTADCSLIVMAATNKSSAYDFEDDYNAIINAISYTQKSEASQVSSDTPAESSAPSASVPAEYQSALAKAASYSKTMHMSKAGLYKQLTSEYGEKFSAEAAQYAVDNLNADWNANALAKAKSYSDSMHMSKQGIYDQLTSEYGEEFTAEEAQYAIDNLVADWNANALAKAKSYQKSMNMSPDAIRDQLCSDYGEQFTAEEADYAVAHLND